MHIISFYQSQLESLGYARDGDLLVYAQDGTPAYFTYNKEKRRLALPTSAMIRKGMEDTNGNECHAYHPLCESVLQGESGTIRFLKKAIRNSLWCRSMELIDAIMEISASGKSIRAAAYKKFMTEVICEGIKEPKLDEKLKASWVALSNHVESTTDVKKRTNLFIASDMSVDGSKYVRVANFKHMFEEETLDDTATYFGVKLNRKQDKVIIHRLLMAVFGWYPSLCGSNDNRPYFGCLARGWAQYVVNYNQIVKGLREHTALKTLSDEWIGQLDSLSQYDNVIQTLPFNTGSQSKEPGQDTTKQEYRIKAQPDTTPTQRFASKENDEPKDELDAFFKKRLGTSDRSGRVNIAALPLVQQQALQKYGQLISPQSEGPSVMELSLVKTHGGRKAQSVLGTMSELTAATQQTGNSLLDGGGPRLAGLGGGNNGLLNTGPQLGPINGGTKDGYHW